MTNVLAMVLLVAPMAMLAVGWSVVTALAKRREAQPAASLPISEPAE